MSKKRYQYGTPGELWEKHVGNSVELFISFFHAENPPITDINEMCKVFAKEICHGLSKPYTIEQEDYYEKLLKQYVCNYINKIGGYHKLELFTKEEVEAIGKEARLSLLNAIKQYIQT